ncbi:MAG: hypothetical protein IIA88_08385 [Bacteroidetes bacterium]|nr:hypothetical protein [Bacteroidota bacterium]
MKKTTKNSNKNGFRIRDYEKLPKYARDAYPDGIIPQWMVKLEGWKSEKEMYEWEDIMAKRFEKTLKKNNKSGE